MEFKITDDIPLIGQPLKEIKFREGVLLVGVLRYGEMIIPHGESILQVDDSVFFLGLKAVSYTHLDVYKRQGILIHMYERMFREYGRTVGQILLTKEDSTGRHSYLNLRNTLHTLLQLNVIPIINENDVVAI